MRQRLVSSELAMFGNVVPSEMLQLGNGCRGWGLRESKGYGGVRTGERENEI